LETSTAVSSTPPVAVAVEPLGVRQLYERSLAEHGYHSDPAQLGAVDALERCERDWIAYKARRRNPLTKWVGRPALPRGVYLYGGVGRGKSFLMDCFFQSLPLQRKTRLHFHEFMREVHRGLTELRGIKDPLDELGRRMARRFRVVCLDEFHVADITDAMILYRLLESLFDPRVGIVTTSNFKPDDLYPDGLHRARILPAIEWLNTHLDVVDVDNGIDYRRSALQQIELYHTPLGAAADAAMARAFAMLTDAPDEDPLLYIEQRQLKARRRAGDVVWFEFKVLCGSARSQNDYLELAARFHTVLLSDVPQMTPRQAAAARRFTWLVDVLYDRRIKLVMSAAVPAELLYNAGPLAHEFARTVSRLYEMRSADFLALPRRDVDTTLT
jgi:cell division protein ZapE